MRLNRSPRLLTILFVATVFGSAPAATPEPIRLLDPDGRPVARARVTLSGTTGAVITDADGYFVLSPEPRPPYELAVFAEDGSWLGLVRVQQLGTGEGRRVMLPRVESVNVRGGVAPETRSSPAAAATVISRGETEIRQPERLLDVLDEIPGSSRVGSGHGAVPALRGLAGGRTLILLDDARVTSERRAGPSATFLDPFSIASLEVVRGPGSVAYGSDAIGGVIHARTPLPSAKGFSGRYRLAAGAGVPTVGGSVEVNLPVGKGAVLVQAHQRDFDDYASPRGEIEDSDAEDRGFLVKALIPGKVGRVVLGVQVDDAREVGKPRDASGSITRYPDEDSIRFNLAAELPTPKGLDSFELHAFTGRYQLVTDREAFATPTSNRTFERAIVDARDASFRLEGSKAIHAGSLRFGLDMSSRFDLEATSLSVETDAAGVVVSRIEDEAIDGASRFDAGLFLEGERVIFDGGASLLVGLRGQGIWTDNEGGFFGDRSTSTGTLSGFAGLSFRPAERWTVNLQAARGFREPFLSDRYFAGVTGRGFIEGNPDLRSETSRQFDLSAQRTGGVARLGIYGYHYTIDDLIERYRDADGDFAFRNRGEARIIGLEGELDIRFGQGLSGRVALNWAEGEIVDDGSFPDNIPAPSAGLSFRHAVGERLWWRVGYAYHLRDTRPGPSERVVPGHGVLELATGWKLAGKTELQLSLKNVLDHAYPASSDDDSVLAPGLHGNLALTGRF